MSARKRSKKGAMPPALKRYWAKRRGKSRPRIRSKSIAELSTMSPEQRDSHFKRYYEYTKSSARRKRANHRLRNPVTTFRLAIQKGNNKGTRLYYDGKNFSSRTHPTAFGSLALVKAKAHFLHKKYARVLKDYTFLAVPRR